MNESDPAMGILPPIALPILATVEVPGLVVAAKAWLAAEDHLWHGFAVPFFDEGQLATLLKQLRRRGLAFGQVRDDGVVVLDGPALAGPFEVRPLLGVPADRDAEMVFPAGDGPGGGRPERFWSVGGGRWPWREKSAVRDEPLAGWPPAAPTPGPLRVGVVRPEGEPGWRLVAEDGTMVASGLSEADAARMALCWNHALGVDGIALAGGVLEAALGLDAAT